MAHFRGTIKGRDRIGEASRLGDDRLLVEANGWFGGVTVELARENEKDIAEIWLTTGSAKEERAVLIWSGEIMGDLSPEAQQAGSCLRDEIPAFDNPDADKRHG